LMLSRITPLTRAMGVRAVITRPNSSYRSEECTVTQQTSSVWAYEVTSAPLRRAYFPRKLAMTTQPALILFSVASLDWNPEEVGYINTQEADERGKTVAQDFKATATIFHETGREMRIALSQVTTSPATLIISDTHDPWWHAYAGDKEIPINKANYAFKSVLVPPGISELRLTYEVPYWGAMVSVSFVSVLAALFLVFVGFARHALAQRGKAA
ncbi:MAG: hypothetical protein N2Z21_05620, partial [Candidatus Sumerlaeaceae bacterium]|nr:hypothetical protein [Candidatus Sumerlaeaceae bacterium]